MGAEQLTGVMDIVMRDAAEKAGRKVNEEMANQRKAMFQKMVEDKADVYYTSSRMIDDAIIDPRDTRNVLGFCLSISFSSEWAEPHVIGISRM
jgi:acyl-CoA carboxylase subunit beta